MPKLKTSDTVHIIKLSVGSESFTDLAEWQAERLADMKRKGKTPELIHVTRNTPRRADEVLNGGSIYWVIKGWICARQELLELRPMTEDGIPQCGLVYDKKIIRVRPTPRRAFQGWRYLDPKDAPPDLTGSGEDDLPDEMRRELRELGLV